MQSKGKKGIKPRIRIRTFTIIQETYRLTYGKLRFVPFIRLRGNWLNRAGFHVDQKIKVYISHNRLVIVPKKRR